MSAVYQKALNPLATELLYWHILMVLAWLFVGRNLITPQDSYKGHIFCVCRIDNLRSVKKMHEEAFCKRIDNNN